jgi:hypothetical protein
MKTEQLLPKNEIQNVWKVAMASWENILKNIPLAQFNSMYEKYIEEMRIFEAQLKETGEDL